MNVIVRIKVRQGQRRGLLRHGGRWTDELRMHAANRISWTVE